MSEPERSLRILMIAPTSFFSDYGGHIRIYEEIKALQKRGHQVTVVTYYKGRDVPGFDIRRTAPLPYRAEYEVGSSRHKIAFDAYLLPKAIRVAQQIKPDIVHGHMHEGALIGWAVSRLLKIPLVFDFQGSLSAEMVDHNFLTLGSLPYKFVHRAEMWINHRPDAILTSSNRAQKQLSHYFGVPDKAIRPLPDCVDMKRFSPDQDAGEQAALLHHLGIDPDVPIIAYLGLLADYQGTHHLIEAAKIMKGWGKRFHMLIMGYPNVDTYQRLATSLGVSDCVTLTGRIPYEKAPLYLSVGKLAVSAKMSKTEGSGKLLNYMALGIPVVAYDTEVHREFLGEDGVYAAVGDVGQFAVELAKLLDEPKRGAEIGRKLQDRAVHLFSWDKAADEIVAVYADVLERV